MAKWSKGQSGNPSGRPRGMAGLARYIREKTDDGRELADFVLKVARGQPVETEVFDSETGLQVVRTPTLSDQQWAIGWLSDRGFGKPVASLELNDVTEGPGLLTPGQVAKLDDMHLAALQALLKEADDESE